MIKYTGQYKYCFKPNILECQFEHTANDAIAENIQSYQKQINTRKLRSASFFLKN